MRPLLLRSPMLSKELRRRRIQAIVVEDATVLEKSLRGPTVVDSSSQEATVLDEATVFVGNSHEAIVVEGASQGASHEVTVDVEATIL